MTYYRGPGPARTSRAARAARSAGDFGDRRRVADRRAGRDRRNAPAARRRFPGARGTRPEEVRTNRRGRR